MSEKTGKDQRSRCVLHSPTSAEEVLLRKFSLFSHTLVGEKNKRQSPRHQLTFRVRSEMVPRGNSANPVSSSVGVHCSLSQLSLLFPFFITKQRLRHASPNVFNTEQPRATNLSQCDGSALGRRTIELYYLAVASAGFKRHSCSVYTRQTLFFQVLYFN